MNLRRVTLRYLGWCPGVKSASKFIPDRDVDNRFIIPVIIVLSFALWFAGPGSITIYRESIEPPKIGEARVFREEKLFFSQPQSGDAPYARYWVKYEVVFYSESDIFILRDRIVPDPETSFIGAYSYSENSKIEYNATDGGVTIEIIEPHKTEIYIDSLGRQRTRRWDFKYEFDITFNSTPVSKFVPGFGPEFSWEPNDLHLGQDTDIEVAISPFRIQDTIDLDSVTIETYFKVHNPEITYLSSRPEAVTPSENSCLWAYEGASEFGEHWMKYHVKIRDEEGSVFVSGISLNYRKPLYIESDPSFEGADADFGDIGSTFSYWFTYRIEDK